MDRCRLKQIYPEQKGAIYSLGKITDFLRKSTLCEELLSKFVQFISDIQISRPFTIPRSSTKPENAVDTGTIGTLRYGTARL